jgi:hypothetical protein
LNNGGNHQSFRIVEILLNSPTPSTEASLTAFSGKLDAVYDPSQGAIQSVDFLIDTKNMSEVGDGHLVGAAIKQDGLVFVALDPQLFTPETGWVGDKSQPGLKAEDFLDAAGSSANPNFTASGSPIEFGFFNASSAPAGSTTSARTVALDNWSVTLNTASVNAVPLPAPLPLGLVGLACAGLAYTRRGWFLRTAG